MQTATLTRISRHARIPGDFPVCLYPLQGRNVTKRHCQHMLCTPCYLDGVQLELMIKDSSFNANACEQCRNTPCTKTHHDSTLMEHSTSPKSTKQLTVATAKPRAQGPTSRQGPSARDAGIDTRAGRPKSKTAKEKGNKNKKCKEYERKEQGRRQTVNWRFRDRSSRASSSRRDRCAIRHPLRVPAGCYMGLAYGLVPQHQNAPVVSKDGLLTLNAPRLIQCCMMCTLQHHVYFCGVVYAQLSPVPTEQTQASQWRMHMSTTMIWI